MSRRTKKGERSKRPRNVARVAHWRDYWALQAMNPRQDIERMIEETRNARPIMLPAGSCEMEIVSAEQAKRLAAEEKALFTSLPRSWDAMATCNPIQDIKKLRNDEIQRLLDEGYTLDYIDRNFGLNTEDFRPEKFDRVIIQG